MRTKTIHFTRYISDNHTHRSVTRPLTSDEVIERIELLMADRIKGWRWVQEDLSWNHVCLPLLRINYHPPPPLSISLSLPLATISISTGTGIRLVFRLLFVLVRRSRDIDACSEVLCYQPHRRPFCWTVTLLLFILLRERKETTYPDDVVLGLQGMRTSTGL